MKIEAGTIVALTECPIWTGPNSMTKMSGLFVLEDYEPYEPSAYQWEGGWILFPEGEQDNPDIQYFVTDADLIPQVNPKLHGQMLVEEREMEFMAEREYA